MNNEQTKTEALHPGWLSGALPPGKKLLPFQTEAVGKMLTFLNSPSNGVYNACEQGLGKTIQTIACLNVLKAKRVLIICPAVMRLVWEDELCRWSTQVGPWSTEDDSGRTDVILSGGEVHSQLLEKHYCIVSYNLAATDRVAEILSKNYWDVLVCDEFHYLKSTKANRTKSILGTIWKKCGKKIALSGTPCTDNVIDLYTACKSFAGDLFRTKKEFAGNFCNEVRTPWGVKYEGIKNAEALSRLIRAKFFVRYRKDEVLKELPDKVFQRIQLGKEYLGIVKLTAKEKEQQDIEAHNILKGIEAGKPPAVSVSFASKRQDQAIKKLPAVIEFCKELLDEEVPIVLFAFHRSVLDGLSAALVGFNPVRIDGSTGAEERKQAVDSFQAGGSNLFIGQIVAAGVGITLTRASVCVFAELDWSPANIAQATDRLHRIGQKACVNVYYFVVEGSVEAKIENAVVKKATEFQKFIEN